MTVEEQATIEALTAEHDKLEEEYADADELPDEVDARLGEIETALLALEDRPVKFDPAEIARAGVFVSIARDGTLRVDRGYVPRGRSAVRHRTSQRRRTSARRTRRGRTRIIGSSTGRHNHWRAGGNRRRGRRCHQTPARPTGQRTHRLPHAYLAGCSRKQSACGDDSATA